VDYTLPADRMPEAEVSLRLAFHLSRMDTSGSKISVAIDGAQVRNGEDEIFPIVKFLACEQWAQTGQEGRNPWQGSYESKGKIIVIHARPGGGDVVANIGQRTVFAECKGGPLIKKPGSKEYPKLREAIGQLMTAPEIRPGDFPVAVVPATTTFRRLASEWASSPLILRSGISFALVSRDGAVEGFENC
jgi:hypothetical protein